MNVGVTVGVFDDIVSVNVNVGVSVRVLVGVDVTVLVGVKLLVGTCELVDVHVSVGVVV